MDSDSAVEMGEPTKAVPTRALLNALNEHKRMMEPEGATDQDIAEQPSDGDVANGEESDLDPVDGWEDLDGEFSND